jgi:hypothetical protein
MLNEGNDMNKHLEERQTLVALYLRRAKLREVPIRLGDRTTEEAIRHNQDLLEQRIAEIETRIGARAPMKRSQDDGP